MTSLLYFGNISVEILSNNNKMNLFRIYTEKAVEKCPKIVFLNPQETKILYKT